MRLDDNLKKDENLQEEEVQAVKETKPKKTAATKTAQEDSLDKSIASWKATYGKIYKNMIDETNFVIWRPIKRKEYKAILQLEEEGLEVLNKQEEFVKAAVLYPDNAEELIESRAGLASVLSEEILKHSGFEISDSQEL